MPPPRRVLVQLIGVKIDEEPSLAFICGTKRFDEIVPPEQKQTRAAQARRQAEDGYPRYGVFGNAASRRSLPARRAPRRMPRPERLGEAGIIEISGRGNGIQVFLLMLPDQQIRSAK